METKPKILDKEIQIFDNCIRICFSISKRIATEHAREIAANIYKNGDGDWENVDIFHERLKTHYNYTVDVPRKIGEEYGI